MEKLAIEGGPKAKTTPNIPMYPGGLEIGEAEKKEVMETLDRKYLFRYYGPKEYPSKVAELEKRFTETFDSKYALAVNSCTSALISSMVAVEAGPGSEVIVPGYTFFASCAAIIAAKAVPVICEVDDSLTLDPADLEQKINENTKAVIAVHMRGVPCDMGRITEICKRRGVKLIEDVAQACGGSYQGKKLGTFGDIGCFSFQYHKIITAGEGGMCLTDNERLYDRLMAYHDTAACWRPDRFGMPRYEGEVFCGVNFRMSELSGAVMLAQFSRLEGILSRMRTNKKRIKEQIMGLKGITFRRLNDQEGDTAISLVFFLNGKEKVKPFVEALKAEGIDAGGIFDNTVPDWHIYAHWKHIMDKVTPTKEGCPYTCPYHKGKPVEYTRDMCPKTLEYLSRSVHLDIPAQLTAEDCDMIAGGIRKVAETLL